MASRKDPAPHGTEGWMNKKNQILAVEKSWREHNCEIMCLVHWLRLPVRVWSSYDIAYLPRFYSISEMRFS